MEKDTELAEYSFLDDTEIDSLTCGEGKYACSNSPSLVVALQEHGNECDDWSRLYFRSEVEGLESARFIKDCTFTMDAPDQGGIFIGRFQATGKVNVGDGSMLPNGLYRCNFSGRCLLQDGCRISDTPIIRNVAVRSSSIDCYRGTAIISCARVASDGYHSGGYDTEVEVGAENGGRRVCLFEGRTYSEYCTAALTVNPHPGKLEMWQFTQIGPNSLLSQGSSVVNGLIGYGSVITGAVLTDVTLESHRHAHKEETGDVVEDNITINCGSVLSNCVLSAGASVGHCSRITHSYLSEHSAVVDNAFVSNSIVGPDASVSRGECQNSILGPFVGFHHTSLIISALWPLGRGNLGYGCMLGSNHTGRVNDQEFFPGEGCFFGLGASVKFPCNLLGSPYSIIAPGTIIQPSIIKLPFSLIAPSTSNDGSTSSSYNIRPGWVLYSNPYMLERAMNKFSSRRKALQSSTDFPVLRIGTIDSIRSARFRLQLYMHEQIQMENKSESYHHVNGKESGGKDILQNVKSIEKGIEAYDELLKRYALHGLLLLLSMDDDFREKVNIYYDNHLDDMKLDTFQEVDDRYLNLSDVKLNANKGESLRGLLADIASLEVKKERNKEKATPSLPFYAITYGLDNICHQWLVLREEYPTELAKAYEKVSDGSLATASSLKGIDKAILHECSHLLKYLSPLERKYSDTVAASKYRDDDRGVSIIPDYANVNKSMRQVRLGDGGDDVIVSARNRAIAVEDACLALLGDEYLYKI